jgi:hypothetical protein
MVVPLNHRQLNLIKERTGVFFGAAAADMLSPGEAVVPVPAELGGGYLHGSPEHRTGVRGGEGYGGDDTGHPSFCETALLLVVILIARVLILYLSSRRADHSVGTEMRGAFLVGCIA